LQQAANLLQQPKADEQLALARDLQAGTAAELVAYMTSHGLRFGPAAPGDEPAYLTTYRALADYDTRLRGKLNTQPELRSAQYSKRLDDTDRRSRASGESGTTKVVPAAP